MRRTEARPIFCEHRIIHALQRWGYDTTPHHITDLGGAYNGNWRAEYANQSFVVRVRPTWITAQRLSELHALQFQLAERGIATALPLTSLRGDTFEHIDGHFVEIYEYLPEEQNRNWSVARWQSAFEHMGRLHTALTQTGVHPIPPKVSNYATPRLGKLKLQTTIECMEGLPTSRDHKEAMAILRSAETALDKLIAYWDSTYAQLPGQLVHGDYHLDNLLFDAGDHVRYTIDFDFVAWRERLFELAYALRLALPHLTDDPNGMLNTQRIREWVHSYEAASAHPLTDLEWEALPYHLAHVALFFTQDACHHRSPMWIVLRESDYVDLACHLVNYPESLHR